MMAMNGLDILKHRELLWRVLIRISRCGEGFQGEVNEVECVDVVMQLLGSLIKACVGCIDREKWMGLWMDE